MIGAQDDPTAVLFVADREAQPVLSIRSSVAVAQLARAQGESLAELWRSLDARGLTPGGPPFVRYHTFDDTETDVEVGVPVSRETTGERGMQVGLLPGGAAIATLHLGPHDSLGEAYGRLDAWREDHRRDVAGPAWEVYWWIDSSREPDPSSWPAPAEWCTELVQPLAAVGANGP